MFPQGKQEDQYREALRKCRSARNLWVESQGTEQMPVLRNSLWSPGLCPHTQYSGGQAGSPMPLVFSWADVLGESGGMLSEKQGL